MSTRVKCLVRAAKAAAALLLIPSVACAQLAIPSGWGPGGRVGVVSWRDIPFRTVVRQQYDFSCGSAALATLLTHQYGLDTSETDAFTAMYAKGDQAKIRKVGFSMLDMKRYLAARGFASDGFRLSLDDIARAGRPVIALVTLGRYRHFVVIKGVTNDRVLVGDPALGLKTYGRAEFLAMWNGVAFALRDARAARSPTFNARSEWEPWSRAPVGAVRTQAVSPAELSRNLAPLYQITPVLNVPGAPALNGVP